MNASRPPRATMTGNRCQTLSEPGGGGRERTRAFAIRAR